MKKYIYLIHALICFAISILCASGILQRYITFDGVLNEMSLTVISFILGVLCIMYVDWNALKVKKGKS